MTKSNTSLQNQVPTMVSRKREPASRNHWVPNTDVYVMNEMLVVKVELSGMRREDLKITIEDSQLLISGQRPDGCRISRCKFLVMEINYGTFEKVIDIPQEFDLTKAQAAYQNGFLRIDVPPVESKISATTLPG